MWEDALLSADFRDLRGEYTEYALSIDYGTQNAFSAGLWGKYDGVWYRFDEYYYSGRNTGVQKTDNEYLEDIETKFSEEIAGYRNKVKEARLIGAMPPQKIKVIIDPSAASFIALLRKTDWAKVIPADNAVIDGIRETASALHLGLIKIVDNKEMANWKKEAGGYVWDDKSVEDKPVKIADHNMDACRYFVKTVKIVKPKSNYKSMYE
jgi:PBSX family phage terminase large subunit